LWFSVHRCVFQEILQSLYHLNRQPENWVIKDYAPGKRTQKGTAVNKLWGGGRAHRLLSLAYTLAFTCLLRFDEVLKIQSHDIRLREDNNTLEVSLPFRKTNQFGGEMHRE
jgi:hypothetical protein